MKLKTLALRVILPALGVLVAVLILAVLGNEPTPLRIGSEPNEIWTFIHTGAVAGTRPVKLGIGKRSKWQATATNISWETQFHFRNKQTFATRNTIYDFGTNGAIYDIHSSWRFRWPF